MDYFDWRSVLFYHAYGLIPAMVAIGRLRGYPNESVLSKFVRIHSLTDTPDVRTMVGGYLRRRRLIRTIGFIVGWTVYPLAVIWATRDLLRMGDYVHGSIIFGCFALGVLIGELAHKRRGTAKALLEVRRLDDYLRRFTRWDYSILLSAVGLAAAIGVVWSGGPQQAWRKPDAWYLGSFALVVASVGVVRIAQTWLARRRRPFESEELVQADDVIRMMSVNSLSGFGYAVPLGVFAQFLNELALAKFFTGVISFVVMVLALACVLVSFGLLIGFLRIGAAE